MKRLLGWSCLGGALWTLLVASLLPSRLCADAEVIGYPVFQNYNGPLLIQRYWMLVGGFPLFSAILFEILRRRPQFQALVALDIFEEPSPPNISMRKPSAWRRLPLIALVSFVLGWAGSAAMPFFWPSYFMAKVLLLALAYIALLFLGIAICRRLQPSTNHQTALSFANGIGAACSIAMLYAVSRSTQVTATNDVAVPKSWHWFPEWLLLLGLVIILSLFVSNFRRARTAAASLQAEGTMVYGVAIPVLIFLLHSQLPNSLRDVDLFHVGETVASANLLLAGYFPFRDLLFIHGLLEDPLRSLLGFCIFEKTLWGAAAGIDVLIVPLFWVSMYYLYWALFAQRRLLPLWAGVVLPLLVPSAPINCPSRYLLFPWQTLAFLKLLQRPTLYRASIFSGLLFLQTALVPELTYAVPAFLCTLVLFEARRPLTASAKWRRFVHTFAVLLVLFLLTVALGAFLIRHQALRSFVAYYQIFGSKHVLKGSLPIAQAEWYVQLQAALLLVVFISCIGWFFVALRLRKTLFATDYVALALLLLSIVYFQKYLWRADSAHMYMSMQVALPLVIYAAVLMLRWLDSNRTKFRGILGFFCLNLEFLRKSQNVLLLFIGFSTFLIAAPSFVSSIYSLPIRISRNLERAENQLRIGYADDFEQAKLNKLVSRLTPLFQKGNKSNARAFVFDFSNQPGLFHFVLELDPSTPFFHISMAISRPSQRLAIKALQAQRPQYVVYYGPTEMWHWDGIPNSVRHRDVSEYLLQNYEPLAPATLEDLLILRRKEFSPMLNQRIPNQSTTDSKLAYMRVFPCDWGYVPHFDAPGLEDQEFRNLSAQPLNWTTHHSAHAVTTEITGLSKNMHDAAYLQIQFDDLHADRFGLSDHADSLNTSGAAPIAFSSLNGGQRSYFIQVAACPQWYAFSASKLLLRSTVDHRIAHISLLFRPGDSPSSTPPSLKLP